MDNDRPVPVNNETISANSNALLANQDTGAHFDIHLGLIACPIRARCYLQSCPVNPALSNRLQELK
jgi:hypothetical protein